MAQSKSNNNQQGFAAEYPSKKVFERSPYTGRLLASVVKYDSAMHHVQTLYNNGKISDAKFDKATELSRNADKAIRDFVNQIETLSGRKSRGKRKAKPASSPKAKAKPQSKDKPKAPVSIEAVPSTESLTATAPSKATA